MQCRYHKDFKNIGGEISLYIKKNNHKFCAYCGLFNRANNQRLIKHFNAHHNGRSPSYLKYGDEPVECIYDNLNDFLYDPSIDLKLKQDGKKRMFGRPSKASARIDVELN